MSLERARAQEAKAGKSTLNINFIALQRKALYKRRNKQVRKEGSKRDFLTGSFSLLFHKTNWKMILLNLNEMKCYAWPIKQQRKSVEDLFGFEWVFVNKFSLLFNFNLISQWEMMELWENFNLMRGLREFSKITQFFNFSINHSYQNFGSLPKWCL